MTGEKQYDKRCTTAAGDVEKKSNFTNEIN